MNDALANRSAEDTDTMERLLFKHFIPDSTREADIVAL
jgi:hypothetical protein